MEFQPIMESFAVKVHVGHVEEKVAVKGKDNVALALSMRIRNVE